MAITTLDGALSGMTPPVPLLKSGATMEAVAQQHSFFYTAGTPGAASAPSPGVNGAALTTYAGQIPFTNPVSGNTYLSRLSLNATQPCSIWLCDRLWHNSGLSATSTSLQAITSGAMPARDANGSTNGVGLMCGIEWSATGGAGTPTLTLSYTNQAGTGGKSATVVGNATPVAGTFEVFRLAAGDTGIRNVDGYTASATRTSGTFHLVVFRILATLDLPLANVGGAIDALTSGFPRLYNDSVPFLVAVPSSTTALVLSGSMSVSQG